MRIYIVMIVSLVYFQNDLYSKNDKEVDENIYFWLGVGQGINQNIIYDHSNKKKGSSESVSFNAAYKNHLLTISNNLVDLNINVPNSIFNSNCSAKDSFNELSVLYGLIIKLDYISFSLSTGISYTIIETSKVDKENMIIDCNLKDKVYSFGIPLEYNNILYFKHFGFGFKGFINFNDVQSYGGLSVSLYIGVFNN